ncbi:hypothetical protein [Vulgatibacter sp.]|uniref:hypothetical protein n=1 Tax=Vulgatibacter sp. TaxID=1971226 RepID=UPI003563E3EA
MRRFCLSLVFAALAAGCATSSSSVATTQRDLPPIETRALRGTERFRVVTEGLEPEVAVEGVLPEDVTLGRAVLEATLQALPAGEPPRPGAIVDLRLGRASARVQLVSASGNALLVVDVPPTGASVRPKKAMATAAFARAHLAWEGGDAAAARTLALAAVRLLPGDPLEAGSEESLEEANAQNHLAWALLAQLSDGAERERWYVGALERSAAYLATQLGGPPAALLEPHREELFAAARAIVEENLAAYAKAERRGGAGGPVEFPSPIWTTPRQPVLLPAEFVGLYAGEGTAALLRSDAFLALAVDAFERLRADPVELLLATREIRSLYLQEDLFAAASPEGRPFDKMLSALIADVARKAAAGLTEAEIAATFGAEADARTLALARTKLAAQRDREASWYGAALHAADR